MASAPSAIAERIALLWTVGSKPPSETVTSQPISGACVRDRVGWNCAPFGSARAGDHPHVLAGFGSRRRIGQRRGRFPRSALRVGRRRRRQDRRPPSCRVLQRWSRARRRSCLVSPLSFPARLRPSPNSAARWTRRHLRLSCRSRRRRRPRTPPASAARPMLPRELAHNVPSRIPLRRDPSVTRATLPKNRKYCQESTLEPRIASDRTVRSRAWLDQSGVGALRRGGGFAPR